MAPRRTDTVTPAPSQPGSGPIDGDATVEDYVSLPLGDGCVIVYDRQNSTGWVQSDIAKSVAEAR